MPKIFSLRVYAAITFILLTGCSSTPQTPVTTIPTPTPTPQIIPEVDQKEKVKLALIEEFRVVRSKLNSANESAESEYLKTKAAIAEEQLAGWSTDVDAESKAEIKHAKNDLRLIEAQNKNLAHSLAERKQIVKKPEYQKVFQDLGVSTELVTDEPVENTLDRLTAP